MTLPVAPLSCCPFAERHAGPSQRQTPVSLLCLASFFFNVGVRVSAVVVRRFEF